MIGEALTRVVAGETLSRAEMSEVIRAIMQGEEHDVVVAALLTALRQRGETNDELAGAAQTMRELAVPLPEAPAGAIDTCGTGGDDAGTFNISTVAALIVAGAGVPVAKHGNRAATSRCGSAELLEALGIPLELPPERMAAAVHEVGIGFLYARACHPAMKRVAPIRAELPIPTLFNRLGPLTNPMRPRRQLLGVGRRDMMEGAVEVLSQLGCERVWVVHGEDGLDEVSPCAVTHVLALEDGTRRSFEIAPGEVVPESRLEDLQGGDAAENAALAREILSGKPGAQRDAVVLNAAAALCVAGTATDLAQGAERATASLDTGAARERLERWLAFCAGEGGA